MKTLRRCAIAASILLVVAGSPSGQCLGQQTRETATSNEVSWVPPFLIDYVDFDPNFNTAFVYALTIWKHALSLTDTIRIRVQMEPFEGRGLGYVKYNGGTLLSVPGTNDSAWYPFPLAERLEGVNLNGDSADIEVHFNRLASWNYEPWRAPTGSENDFVTAVLHELGHGLGFVHSFRYADSFHTTASWGGGSHHPANFDRYVVNGSSQQLVSEADFPNSSQQLLAELESDNLYFLGSLSQSAHGGQHPKLESAITFDDGESVAHLDSAQYYPEDDGLMVRSMKAGDTCRTIGPITLAMMKDLGWRNIRRVPSDQYATIQAAIDASSSGDMIFVGPGTNGPIEFAGRDIVIMSQSGASVTTITGNGVSNAVTFASLETPNAQLIGFTITGGNPYGIACYGSSTPTISACTIYGNAESPAQIPSSIAPYVFGQNTFIPNAGGQGNGIRLRPDAIEQSLSLPRPPTGFCYFVGGTMTVAEGDTLRVEPGTILKLEDDVSVVITGVLQALGTPVDSVVFTSMRDDAYGGDTNGDGTATVPAPGDWSTIHVHEGSVIQNAVVRYGGTNYYGTSVEVDSGLLVSSTVELSAGAGAAVYNGGRILNSTLRDCDRGIEAWGGLASANVIQANNNGIEVRGGSPVISDNVISSSLGAAIFVRGSSSLNAYGNSGSGNNLNAIQYYGHLGYDLYILNDTRWRVNATLPYVVNQFVRFDSALTIDPGVVVKFETTSSALLGSGPKLVQGTAMDPVVFTSIRDDSSGGDTNGDGTATLPAVGDWRYINLPEGSGLDHARVRFGASSYNDGTVVTTSSPISNSTVELSYGAGISVLGDAAIEGNLVRNNGRGIDILAGSSQIRSNRIQGNWFGVTNNNKSVIVDGLHNWWGDASGPSGEGPGTGDAVNAYVNYDPWIGKPDTVDCTAPGVSYMFPVSDAAINFSTLPEGGGTVTVKRYWEIPPSTFAPPPEQSSFIGVWFEITSELPNSQFAAECAVDVAGIEAFNLLSSAAYYNPTTEQWETIGGLYDPTAHTFRFSTDHFSAFGFLNADSPVPVTLTAFTAQSVSDGAAALLRWTTVSEINNYGFWVQRRASDDFPFLDLPGSFISGHGTTNYPQEYSYTDSVGLAGSYEYRLKQVDLDGTVHYPRPIKIELKKQVSGDGIPTQISLFQNFPNPFNPTTTIRYSLPHKSKVVLAVFNTLGQEVARLVHGVEREAGYHEVAFDSKGLASGVYLYRLQAEGFVQTKKLLILR